LGMQSWCGSVSAAEPLDDAKSPPAGPVLAWARIETGPESYKEVPYLWLGKYDIALTIDVVPRPGHALHFLWGSKNDDRRGLVRINGHDAGVRQGGYDGFRWLEVPMPDRLSGAKYEVLVKADAGGAPGFIAAVVLSDPPQVGSGSATMEAASRGITVNAIALSSAPARVEAFPEMRPIWDTPLVPASPRTDPGQEAAFRRAERNARRANEMLFRSRRFVDGWLAHADKQTGLIPRNLTRDTHIWNPQDSAADNYPFMVLTCALTDRALFDGRMLDMLRTETRLTSRVDRLPDTFSFTTQGFAADGVDMPGIIFGSSEYVKDGLMPLTEWLGPSPWCDRMIDILEDIWKHAAFETPFGTIPSNNIEVNGEQLQVLCRIFWMTGDAKYLDWAQRIGDYYLLGDQHPTRNQTRVALQDHGCEIISGLCELYTTVHYARPQKKKAYEPPLREMMDRILEVGRNDHGLFHFAMNPKTGEAIGELTDNWGYNLNGFYDIFLVDGVPAYRHAVRDALSNLKAHYTGYRWQGGSADGYADSIEGAINLFNREPIDSALEWIDTEIDAMWAKQGPDGVIEGWHGDGNVARTAIMFALLRTCGLTVQPWRADVRIGAVEKDGAVYVSLYAAEESWTGRLVADKPRHRVNLNLPIDYPRINQFPEWFTVASDDAFTVGPAGSGEQQAVSGAQFLEGVPITLPPRTELRLVVARTGAMPGAR